METLLNRKPKDFYAKVTAVLEQIYCSLWKCSEHLHRFLLRLRPPGVVIELELAAFCNESGYSIKHARKSLRQLEANSLLEVKHDYGRGVFRVIVYRPDQRMDAPNGASMRQIEGSNPDSFVESLSREEQQTPNHLPVAVGLSEQMQGEEDEQEKSTQTLERLQREERSPGTSQGIEGGHIPPHLLAIFKKIEASISPIPLHPQLAMKLASYSVEQLEQALKVLQDRIHKGKVRNPAGLFVSALEQGWVVTEPVDSEEKSSPPVFPTWFNRALSAGIAKASQMIDGALMILTADYEWEPWESLLETYPWECPDW